MSIQSSWLALCAAALLAPLAHADDESGQSSQLSGLLGSDPVENFPRVTEPRSFSFPADHGPHPDYRNEWWYITGNLDDENGRRFGFELTIFRFALSAAVPVADSNWRTRQVYIAHFAVTDAASDRFYVAERFSRSALGLAGATAEPFRVWINDWEIAANTALAPNRWQLAAADEEFALQLQLTALKPPVLNGVQGLSRKSDEPGNASYYYSITRWDSQGTLRIGDRSFQVSGLSWLDREWSSSALAADQQGWDWFALQLSDGSDLMFYNLRKTDGSQDRNSAGTWVGSSGEASYLRREDLELIVNRTWDSPAGGSYPASWTLRIPAYGLSLEVRPVIADQELFTTVRYWEGAVDVTGEAGGKPISGRGYVELTGYAE